MDLKTEKKRTFVYRIGIGIEGMVFKAYYIEAHNWDEARSIGISRFLHPNLGYNFIDVRRVPKTRENLELVKRDS